MKKKTGINLRLVFHTAALTVMGAHFASYALVTRSGAEITDDIAEATGTTPEKLRQYAQSPFLILNPAHENTRLFFTFSLNAKPSEQILYGESFNAQAQQHPYMGHGTFLDRLSGGILGAMSPCLVTLNPANVTKKSIARVATTDFSQRITHIAGSEADYLKLVTLHELEHCRTATVEKNLLLQEYLADRRTLHTMLAEGTSPEVIRTWISLRSLAAINYSLSGRDTLTLGNPYTMAPALYAELIAGTRRTAATLEDLETLQSGYDEASYVLQKNALKFIYAPTTLLDPENAYYLSQRVLRDPDIRMSAEARTALKMNILSYEYLSGRTPTTPAAVAAPGIS